MKVLDLRKGEWTALDDPVLEELTVESEQPGRFGMRLLAAEVYRLRADVRLLREALKVARRETHLPFCTRQPCSCHIDEWNAQINKVLDKTK